MKIAVVTLAASGLLGLAVILTTRTEVKLPHPSATARRVPVVVELFTSEGCSSCPPADAFLKSLDENQPFENVEIIAMEEHVDYWNDLGWRDPYSSQLWTFRQYIYADQLRNRNPYTPQMVVNGRTELVGNQSSKARESILNSAAQPQITVALSAVASKNPGTSDITIQVDKPASGAQLKKIELWLGITETNLSSSVRGGENSGRELRHAPVLRSLKKVGQVDLTSDGSFTGAFQVGVQKDWKRENLKVVAFLSERKSGQIVGATQVHMNP
jgi:hypothetical protein